MPDGQPFYDCVRNWTVFLHDNYMDRCIERPGLTRVQRAPGLGDRRCRSSHGRVVVRSDRPGTASRASFSAERARWTISWAMRRRRLSSRRRRSSSSRSTDSVNEYGQGGPWSEDMVLELPERLRGAMILRLAYRQKHRRSDRAPWPVPDAHLCADL